MHEKPRLRSLVTADEMEKVHFMWIVTFHYLGSYIFIKLSYFVDIKLVIYNFVKVSFNTGTDFAMNKISIVL